MPKASVLKLFFHLLTLPTYCIGNLFIMFNLFDFEGRLLKCTRVVDARSDEIPNSFIGYLISAEDHRSLLHQGIDHIGMLRAVYKNVSSRETQGASTIEQQFVRVVTGDYSRSLTRKFMEQVLATHLSKRRKKADTARAYLAIAYYGHNCIGRNGISNLIGSKLELASEKQIITIVAQLKYPKPMISSREWEDRISSRVSYICTRHEKATNKAKRRVLRTAA